MKTFKLLPLLFILLFSFNSCEWISSEDGKCAVSNASKLTYNISSPKVKISYSDSFIDDYLGFSKIEVESTLTITKTPCGESPRTVFTQYQSHTVTSSTPYVFSYSYMGYVDLNNTADYVTVAVEVKLLINGRLLETYNKTKDYQYLKNAEHNVTPYFNIYIN